LDYKEWYFWSTKEIGKLEEDGNHVLINTGYQKFLNLCKKKCEPESIGHFEGNARRSYFIRDGWRVTKSIFNDCIRSFEEMQNKSVEKWKKQPNIFKLIAFLRLLFKRNQDAHKNLKLSTRSNAFAAKNKYLRAAINLAHEINLPFFKWGVELDPECVNYEIIVYFQIGGDQISFHTDYIAPAPKFDGHWIGYGQMKFPFSFHKIRRLLKESNIQLNELSKKKGNIPKKKIRLYNIMEDVGSIRDEYRDELNFYKDDNFF